MKSILKTVNLEVGMPTVPQARARLTSEIQSARQASFSALKIVHGYGSSGVGGDLRIALQATLAQMTEARQVNGYIFGENWRKSDDRSWTLLKRFPELKYDSDFGKGNKGITIVIL